MKRECVAVIKGPNELIPGGVKFEKVEITEEEIREYLEEGEEGETEDDAIEYILNEYISAWEQRLCHVGIISVEEFNKLYNHLDDLIVDDEDDEKWFDNEEEEEEESEWDEWE